MPLRKVLVIGSSGKQGSAVVKALLASPTNFEILALTRSPNSNKAQFLALKPNVTIVGGEPTDPVPIFAEHPVIYGVFCMTVPGDHGAEEKQAKRMIDAAIEHRVEHFVLSTVDRGGAIASPGNQTGVPNFAAKCRIEEYLKSQVQQRDSKMQWTILRPAAFMDNLNPGMLGKSFASMWLTLENKPLQLVSVHDIGVFAAKAFCDPAKFDRRSVSLAGDELTLEQARWIFREKMGSDLPETYSFVGSAIQWIVTDLGTVFQWYKWVGHGADIKQLRRDEPRLQDFGMWLLESSKHFRE